jgi:putative ABC transport system permease protein
MSTRLPHAIVWLTRRVVPAGRVETVLADLADDYRAVAAGWSARRWLLRETASLLGAYGLARLKNIGRQAPFWTRDLQLVLRSLRRGPMAAGTAAAMLAVGVAAVLLTAGLTNTLLFREVSATHGDALRRIVAVDRQGRVATRFSFIEMQRIREQIGDAGVLAAVYLQPVVLRAAGLDLQTMAEIVEGPYFALTGTSMLIGRGLMAADDRSNAPPVTVIAEPFWRRRFGASAGVLGTAITMNGAAYTVVGVAATLGSASSLGASVDAWVPIAQADPLLDRDWRTAVGNRWFMSFVLPTGGSSIVDARLAIAATDLAAQHADTWRDRRLQTADALAVIGAQRRAAATLLAVLAALAALILAAAASSVSGVLLARAASHRRVTAIHLSIGAGRAAIVRRQLIEGALLGCFAACIAVALYSWARQQLAEIALLPTLALRLDLPLDSLLVAATLAAGSSAGLLLAIVPALWGSRLNLVDALRDGGSGSGTGRALTKMRRVLVSIQVALSVVLVCGAVLFARSVNALVTSDLGFDRSRLVAVDFDVAPSSSPLDQLPQLAAQALARVESIPGVIAAAMSNRAPVDQSAPTLQVQATRESGAAVNDVTMYLASARYFDVVNVPMLAGRAFSEAEAAARADVVIVNEALASVLWPSANPLDRALYVPSEGKMLRVIGVARNAKYRAIAESNRPHVYRPTPPALGLTLLARTNSDPRDTLRAIQGELDRVGPGLVGFFPRTLDDHLAIQVLPARAAAAAATGLGTLALLLSAAALYGLVSWFVALRGREIGLRMALGATTSDVRRLVVRQAMVAAGPGMLAGAGLSIGLGLAAESVLYGVGPLDPVALTAGIGMLAVVVLMAAYLPSRWAAKVDPALALRH